MVLDGSGPSAYRLPVVAGLNFLFVRLAEACDLKLTGADRVEHKGGSIHLIFHPADAAEQPDEFISKLIQRERWLRVSDGATYNELASRIGSAGREVRELLSTLGASEVAGIGASISTTHLLHQFGIGERVTRLFDDDQNKIGRFSPGFGIEVSPLEDIRTWVGGLTILLAWQHSEVLAKRTADAGFVGRTVVPLPVPFLLTLN